MPDKNPEFALAASFVPCQECGREFKMISPTHLLKHGLKIEQYSEKYPGAVLRPTELQKRMDANNSKAWILRSPDAKASTKKKRQKIAAENPARLEKGRTPEVRKKAEQTKRANGTVATPEFLGQISRQYYETASPTKLRRHHSKQAAKSRTSERRKLSSEIAKRNWSQMKARLLPPDLGTKPQTWQMIVPVLVADRAAGGHIGNAEVLGMFGLEQGKNLSKDTMNYIRGYCGVPGPRGRPKKR